MLCLNPVAKYAIKTLERLTAPTHGPAVHVPAQHRSLRCHHPPAKPYLHPSWPARKHCEDHVFVVLQCIPYRQVKPPGWKLSSMQVDASLVPWIVGRPQYVRNQNCVSDRGFSNTGAPQGTVLSSLFFTLYTVDPNRLDKLTKLEHFPTASQAS